MNDLANVIRDIKDFPKEGIVFKDISPILQNPKYFNEAIDWYMDSVKDLKIDKVLGAEARGFIFGAPVASKLNAGFVPARKPGKLPAETISEEFKLEYGTDKFEIHKDSIEPGENVVIIDDLLATGGTAEALCKLVERLGGKVAAVCFLIELDFLKGISKLNNYNVKSLIHF
jgi:adenine phosphoribosyltransferase